MSAAPSLNDHIFVTSGNEVDQLIQPLKDFFGITGFIYKKNFGKGRFIRLANISDFSAQFYQHHLYRFCLLDCDPDYYQSGITTWDQLFVNDGQIIQDVADQYDMNQGCVLTIRSDDIVEHISLGISRESHDSMSRIFNNVDLLERFFLYFKERGADLLADAEKNSLKLSGYDQEISRDEVSQIFKHNELDRDAFLDEVSLTKMKLPSGIGLTKRELDIALELIRGKTASEIGEKLFISARTVETHLQSLKSKFDANSKSVLIARLIENGLRLDGRISLVW